MSKDLNFRDQTKTNSCAEKDDEISYIFVSLIAHQIAIEPRSIYVIARPCKILQAPLAPTICLAREQDLCALGARESLEQVAWCLHLLPFQFLAVQQVEPPSFFQRVYSHL